MKQRQTVISGEYTIIQSEYSDNVTIIKNGKIIKQIPCNKRLTKAELEQARYMCNE